ncbi:MAG: hypothetical protein WC785_07460 [Tatlockia sp.]|jgi:hypothetical protein
MFSTLEKCNIHDLRRAFYLSRENAWFQQGEGLYRLKFSNCFKTIHYHSGPYLHFQKTQYPVSKKEDFDLKLRFSRALTGLEVFEKNSKLHPVHLPFLEQIELYPKEYDFPLLCFTSGSSKSTLQMKVETFDLHFLQSVNASTGISVHENPQQNKDQWTRLYHQHKFNALKESIKTQLWLAAASGDAMGLSFNLTPCRQFFQKVSHELLGKVCSFEELLHENHQGQHIIQAMFRANPGNDLPFSDNPANYSNTLKVLLERGRLDLSRKIAPQHDMTILGFCQQYQQKNMKFFHRRNKIHSEIFEALEQYIKLHPKPNLITPC